MSAKISVMISEEEIDKRVRELAAQISEDYAGESVHMICILKGSIMFTVDLAKRITVPVTLDFMKCSSYGDSTKSSGIVRIDKDTDESLEGKNVIVIEDIIFKEDKELCQCRAFDGHRQALALENNLLTLPLLNSIIRAGILDIV